MLVSHASRGLHPFSITAPPALRVVMLLESGHIETGNHRQSRPFYVGPVWVLRLPPTLPLGRTCKFQTELGLDLNLWPSYCEAAVLTAARLCPTHHTKKKICPAVPHHIEVIWQIDCFQYILFRGKTFSSEKFHSSVAAGCINRYL